MKDASKKVIDILMSVVAAGRIPAVMGDNTRIYAFILGVRSEFSCDAEKKEVVDSPDFSTIVDFFNSKYSFDIKKGLLDEELEKPPVKDIHPTDGSFYP